VRIAQVTGLVVSLMVVGLSLQEPMVSIQEQNFVPSTNLALKQQEKSALKKDNITYIDIREEKQPDGSRIETLVHFFHASKFDGIKMTDVIVVDRSQGKVNRIIQAKSGRISNDKKSWDFSNGKIYEIDSKHNQFTNNRFKNLKVNLGKTPLEIAALDQPQKNSTLKKDNVTYLDVLENTGNQTQHLVRFFYIRKFDDPDMTDVMIIDFSQSEVVRVIEAMSGRSESNIGKKKLYFENATVYDIDYKSRNSTRIQSEHLQMDLGSQAK
jgi:Lipopolysaccharide export system permease LptF/LptG